MALKGQYVIDEVFLRKPWKYLTYSEIQKLSGKSSKGYIYKEIGRLKKEGLINSEQIGKRTILYSIKIDAALSQSYWGSLHENLSWARRKFPVQTIENLSARMPTPFFTLLVTGSYAKGSQNDKSDLDVIIISNEDQKKISAELRLEAETSTPKVHLYVFSKKDFTEMLVNKKENYGKEAARNCMISLGAQHTIQYSLRLFQMDSKVKLHIERAENEILAAQALSRISTDDKIKIEFSLSSDTSFYSNVISHSYYAIFYSAKAYLLSKEVYISEQGQHQTVYFKFRSMVRQGTIREELLKVYEQEKDKADALLGIFESERAKRSEFTYTTIPQANKQPAEDSLSNAVFFVSNIKALLAV